MRQETPTKSGAVPTLELMLHDDVQNLLDAFGKAVGIRILLYSPDGAVIRTDQIRECSEYCRLIQDELMPGQCLALDAAMHAQCLERQELVCYSCHAGLKEAVMPVMMEGQLLGYAMIGQFRDDLHLSDKVLMRCPDMASSILLKQCFSNLTYIPPDRIDGILGMFKLLVNYMVGKELMGFRKDWLFDKAAQFLATRFKRDVRIEQFAKLVGRSVSSVAHLLQERHGTTFKQMLAEKRIAYAEGLIKSNPELSMGEVANMSGFEDKFYFSRVYSKYRGRPPRAFKAEAKAAHIPD